MSSLDALRELLEKYDLMLELHAGKPGRTLLRRDAMRQVATRFPGALREWEKLPQLELVRRRHLVAELIFQARGDATRILAGLQSTEPWLRYSLEFHERLRALLLQRPMQPTQRGRRLSQLAYEEVAKQNGVSVAEVKQAVSGLS